ncbi:MAG TPA: sulfotransferase [Verrucomicrobiae bacterium]|nr:sulfotransferase [Verrucomicrobiae bacterium]
MSPGDTPLDALRHAMAGFSPPIVVYNKSHSGSRLLANLLEASGIFLGANLNESRDSLDILRLVESLVGQYYPDYGPLWKNPRDGGELADLARSAFDAHLEGCWPGQPWGWKLCETAYVLPVIDRIFPDAKYIHLIRDGRDVAFCDHQAPNTAFWRKIYFDTDRIRVWHGDRLKKEQYLRRSHVYNAIHWTNSVAVGRAYGAMMRERLLEVRYEDLCLSFDKTAREILRFAGIARPEPAIRAVAPSVRTASIGKFRAAHKRQLQEVLAIEKPLLLSLGYLQEDSEKPLVQPRRRAPWWRRLISRHT